MKVAKLLKHVRNASVQDTVQPVLSRYDREMYKKGMKRISPSKISMGQTGDDFMQDMYSVVIETHVCRIPRILNPLHKRTKSIKFN